MSKADPDLTPQRRLTAKLGELPDGKLEEFIWDAGDGAVKGFALRIRRAADGRIINRWYYQRRGAGRHELGDPAEMTETQARKKAGTLQAEVVLGGNPQAERQQERENAKTTLKRLAEDYVAHKKSSLTPNSHALLHHYVLGPKPDAKPTKRKRRHTESWLKPFHSKPAASITRAMVSKALVDCETHSGKPSATALKSNTSAMFSWGIRRGCYGIEMNPCIDSHQIEPDAMPSAAKTRMLSEGEIVKIWQGVDADSDYGKIIPLLILTAARRSEIGNMRWSELDDVERPTKLTIPLARLKNRSARVKAGLGALVIPISPLAAGIITSVVPRAGCDSLFGGWRDTGYKNWDDDKKDLDAKIKIAPWTTHHLRRAISTMLGHLGVWPHVVDALTGHVTGKQEPRTAVSVVYNRSPYAAEVKAALTMWSDHVAEVVARDPTLFNERTHQWKLDA